MTYVLSMEHLSASEAAELIGYQDRNLNCLCELYGAEIIFRDNQFTIRCQDPEAVAEILQEMLKMIRRSQQISEQEIRYLVRTQRKQQAVDLGDLKSKVLARTHSGKAISPKTEGQRSFIEAMEKKTIVFAVGPAGTGKTYLAVAYAVSMLKKGEIHRIILTRPAVEAGESLGFLPGDLKEKVDPYLRPLYDALHDLMGAETTEKLIEKGTIEIAPLAYMRADAGRCRDYSGRSAEHDAGPDENVFNPAGLSVTDDHHRRCDAGGSAEIPAQRSDGRRRPVERN